MPRVLTVLLALALAPAALAPADALAQGSMSEAFKGFGANRKDPIQIEADSLEVRDKESVALFSGNVLVRQSQTVMKAARLKVFYDSKPGQYRLDAAKGSGRVQLILEPAAAKGAGGKP
ncbi:hypothetical protein ABB55_13840 [Prosthecomicrobium hirschii]|uniref:Organic solvent tolerance-like N-terminal domain-containing protein n=1 Tax=Prosthecodimorpha hirschii TaxID=665126 RepID=A0A0N8GF28_9HYPH|nr:LptA/OstA family protein [Prosthecomicrobium hirschii]KPL53161.1 hypothetical protein ABB55_13840 [Prosthecomicrobium hirschii]